MVAGSLCMGSCWLVSLLGPDLGNPRAQLLRLGVGWCKRVQATSLALDPATDRSSALLRGSLNQLSALLFGPRGSCPRDCRRPGCRWLLELPSEEQSLFPLFPLCCPWPMSVPSSDSSTRLIAPFPLGHSAHCHRSLVLSFLINWAISSLGLGTSSCKSCGSCVR